MSVFTSDAYIQMHFRIHLVLEVNTLNLDQTAPLGAV